ncbi:MAG TPA: ABC transporter ATP-binding protein [Humidesulfovibrio sp.]|uniref:ABC transporter ATP-binding protein n=1 Tax=Humidesulfovibrio sp. TaxID=2910988 RepID=UPI002BE059AD|nr:ABC transporter ATP-binding protein [Humidesulfovibrio sp.]HWR04849.1 ABC transporter ATP-binding protein [Humidesulfovibrio sp.]
MKELLRRLSLCPRIAWEILAASFLSNLMSLASSIYVILVLNRYVGYGFDGTLYTLTSGVLIASALGFAFGEVRSRLAGVVSQGPDEELGERTLAALARTRLGDLYRLPHGRHQEMLGALQQVQGSYDASNVSAVLDAPFMLIFLLAIALIHPWLMVLTFVAVGLTTVLTLTGLRKGEADGLKYQQESQQHRNLLSSAVSGAETVRAFLGGEFLRRTWRRQVDALAELRQLMDGRRQKSRMRLESVTVLLRVFIYAIGAMLAVAGDMSVGGLIGASILSSKVLQMSTAFLQAFLAGRRGEQALMRLSEFHAMPLEPLSGAALRAFSGRLEFRDVGFAYSGTASPLFESLNFTLMPGTVLCVTGLNGAGKTTFCKVAAGLLEPGRGQVLADGVDLRQMAPDWWRRQVLYMPQEPGFLNTTIRENITLAEPEPDSAACQERLNQAVRAASLKRFLDTSSQGLDMPIIEGGKTLSLGIRRRIALARALMNPGKLVIFDDPTEGLDSEGCLAVYAILNALAKAGLTLVIATADANVLKGASLVLDMNQKPTPVLGAVPARAPKQEDE